MTKQESFLTRFFKLESSSGIILMLAAVAAITLANSPLKPFYSLIIDTPVEIRIGTFQIAKPLLLWINDGLMAIFFFLIGLELKRELIEGELADRNNIILPAVGAIGGMAIPALIYLFLNQDDASAIKGWAIPTATDIAFALGVLSLLGSRVPTSLKIFLTSLAIFDDIGAILIIAIFYTEKMSLTAILIVFVFCIPLLLVLNKKHIESKSLYVLIGIIMWVAMLKSGIHATLTGVILALFIPIKSKIKENHSPLKSMENDLHTVVAFFILPVFAFVNSGITIIGLGTEQLFHPVPSGIALGLFLGKQIGVFSFCWLAIKLNLSRLPDGISWMSLYGTAAICGIGFTMSLFIGSLAFEESGVNRIFDERLGIILGSFASGILGYLILSACLPTHKKVL